MARSLSAWRPTSASATRPRSPQSDARIPSAVESASEMAVALEPRERLPRINRSGAVYYSCVDAESDAALSRRARAGDSEAFGVLIDRYMRRAYVHALGIVGSREDALDLSQEAFVRAYRARHTLDPDRAFYAWLYQILRRLCFNFLRDTKTRARLRDAHAADWVVAVAQRPDWDPAREAERAEERLPGAFDFRIMLTIGLVFVIWTLVIAQFVFWLRVLAVPASIALVVAGIFVATVPFSSISGLRVAPLVTGAADWRRVRRLACTVFVIAGLTILAMVAFAGGDGFWSATCEILARILNLPRWRRALTSSRHVEEIANDLTRQPTPSVIVQQIVQ